MTECSKCVDIMRLQKIQLDTIRDIKPKNEGIHHSFLKNQVCSLLRNLMKENFSDEFSTSIQTEFTVKSVGRIDVVGFVDEASIAVECGNTSPEKIFELEKHFDVVLHIPYCYSLDFLQLDTQKIGHQLFVSIIGKQLEKRGYEFEKNKPICLEEGVCSLPSGRQGYPKETCEKGGKS
jgi:hypothetical protein